jgi:threonine dehydrogenase-like Zn-dependent dehydrogenase
MKSVFVYPKEKIVIEDVKDYTAGPSEAVVRVKACGVCGVDLAAYSGLPVLLFDPAPHTYGHEVSGVVAEVGAGVTGWEKGDRVTVYPLVNRCGNCEHCLVGDWNKCDRVRFIGYTPNPQGGMAEYVKVPAENLMRLPEEIPFNVGALLGDHLGDGGSTVRTVKPKTNHMGVFMGAGISALCALVSAYGLGVREIVCVDSSDIKLEFARTVGAKYTFNTKEKDLIEKIKKLTKGKGADFVIDGISTEESRALAVDVSKNGGSVNLMRVPRGLEDSFTLPNRMIPRHISIFCGISYTKAEYYEQVDLLLKGALPLKFVEDLVANSFPLSDTEKAFEAANYERGPHGKGRTIMINP